MCSITELEITTDIYSERNPTVVKELGDVGNDIKIYGNKVYAVINVSNKIEVIDKWTAKRIKKKLMYPIAVIWLFTKIKLM